jgi:hypothetical protein
LVIEQDRRVPVKLEASRDQSPQPWNDTSNSREGWIEQSYLKVKEDLGARRFERERSNSLWQAQFKLADTDELMISYLGDNSCFILPSILQRLK